MGRDEKNFLKGLLPLVGLLIVALLAWVLLRACQQNPVPLAKPNTIEQVTKQPASLSLALNASGDTVYACGGQLANAMVAQEMLASINQVFGVDQCDFDISSLIGVQMPIRQYLPQVLGFVKGVPDANIRIVDKHIWLNAPDKSRLQTLLGELQVALPDDFVVEMEPVLDEQQTVATAITTSKATLEQLDKLSMPEDLIYALNLQIINFASNSAELPNENQAVLDLAVPFLQARPEIGLIITGHTDNRGSGERNQALSEQRAVAVRDYLVGQGIDGQRIDVVGASFSQPIASNATEQGRFYNRRIEFSLK